MDTNECMRQSRLVHVKTETVKRSPEDEPQISQTSSETARASPTRTNKSEMISANTEGSWQRRANSMKTKPANTEKEKQVEIQRAGSTRSYNQRTADEKMHFWGISRDSVPREQNKLSGQV